MDRKLQGWATFLGLGALALAGPLAADARADVPPRPSIPGVAAMPDVPEPYRLRDWRQVARDYLDILFNLDARGEHLPLIAWQDKGRGLVRAPSFVGGPTDPESINLFAALVGGSLVGVDMTKFRGEDWLRLTEPFFAAQDGVYLNRPGATSGDSFWYDTLPNVLYFQLCDLYPDRPGMRERMLAVARRWGEGSRALATGNPATGLPDFDFTGLQLRTMRGDRHAGRIEPEGGAAIAWMQYMAFVRSGDRAFLADADAAVRALEGHDLAHNPLYEVLLPYGVIAAARLNAEQGQNHDVARLLHWCFEARGDPQARPWWGVISGRWGGQGVDGLVGSVRDGDGYAFAMNSFQYAATLAPLARYDDRYAADLGKWLLNLANAARLFYADSHDPAHQSCPDWSRLHDPKSAIAYEGMRHWKRGAVAAAAERETTRGRRVAGDYQATRLWREAPPQLEVFEEALDPRGDGLGLEHTWEFDLPAGADRWLVIAARRTPDASAARACRFSIGCDPAGPFAEVFAVAGSDRPDAVAIPDAWQGRLFVRVASAGLPGEVATMGRLEVDALAISHTSSIAPFAQGDAVVGYVTAKDDQRVPVVLYRPTSAATDFGLYGSSCVGLLGGIVAATDVERVLRFDLLRTDFFHAPAYPTFLSYNPYDSPKSIRVDLGDRPVDLYDSVSNTFLERQARGATRVDLPARSARVLVAAPAGGTLRRDGPKTLVNDVVIDYQP